MKSLKPTRLENLDPIASEMLERLRVVPEASNIVIGGGVALNCYAPPRLTHDIDAWRSQAANAAERASTVSRIRAIAGDVAAPAELHVAEQPPLRN